MPLPIPRFISERCAGLVLECSKCGTMFSPNWLVPRKFPTTSVPSDCGTGHWIPRIFEECPTCGEKVEVPLPIKKRTGTLSLFGDEAVRQLGEAGGLLYCFATIGGTTATLNRLNASIAGLKARLVPHLQPTEWRLHMKVIWSGDARRKTKEFSHWNRRTSEQLWCGLQEIMGSLDGELWRHCITIAGQPTSKIDPTTFEAYLRDTAYTHLFLLLTDEATDKGAQPMMHFDSQKKVALETAVHGWARRIFRTSEQTLAHAFICHGIPVPEPVFVQPASYPALEIADALSFATARFLFRLEQRKSPDVDLGVFRTVKYITADTETGDLIFQSSVGWPWRAGWQR